jgi:bacterial leucyl aminopeptidase
MHEHHHKCAGFIAHETEADALDAASGTLARRADAPQIVYTINNHAAVNPMIAEVSEQQNRQTIIDLSAFPNRRYNQTSGTNSANWIKNKWTQLAAGRSDITVEFFTHPAATSPQPSVIMTVQGTTLPNEVVVLGGHQDSINGSSATANAPGADDDASGIASLTEVIRVMVAKNFRPQRTVKFMAYAAEEVGLRGSAAIAANYQTTGVNVVGVLQLDMTNYKGSAADIVIITDRTDAAQNQFLRDLITAYQPNLTTINNTCGYACSDHASWNSRGFVASMPFEARINPVEDNPFIHTANDTIDKSGNNANHAIKFTKLAVSYMGELAKGALLIVDPNRTKFDYDGDGKADISVFRSSNGAWYLNQSTAGIAGISFGQASDKIVPADYDGDGKTDVAVYRGGTWYLNRSTAGFTGITFGAADDVPVPADYDGDLKADVAVFRPSNATWYLLQSTAGLASVTFGLAEDKPVPADYDGDGKANVAMFRPSTTTWYTSTNPANNYGAIRFGEATDKLVPSDYDGDGKADVAVFRNGTWYIQRSNLGFTGISFGAAGDVPVAADYDGDGKSDAAVFRGGTWYLNRSTSGFAGAAFGASDDVPTPSAFIP